MKGSLNAFDFADIVEQAFLRYSKLFNVRKIPVADGGDFTGEVLKRKLKAREIILNVSGPLGDDTKSKYFLSEKTAIIEMAEASGMKLIDTKQLNPMYATTYGTGQLINDAVKRGCNQIFLAIGGSATVDGGLGMMDALGFKFMDVNSKTLPGIGKNLVKIQDVIQPENVADVSIKIICDVDNPLLGVNGAAQVFGPQKGATPEMVELLDKGLRNWSEIIEKKCGKNLAQVPGTGAAGGMALPLLAFLNAEIVAGAEFVLAQLDFENHVKWADVVITGEGKIDGQTLNDKAPMAVARWTRKFNKPIFAIGGKTEPEASQPFDGMYSLVNGPMNLDFAIKNARTLLSNISFELAKTIHKLSFKE